jgi:hypothetical protein
MEGGNFLGILDARFVIISLLILIFGTIIFMFYFVKLRNEFVISLRKQQNFELDNNLKLIKSWKKQINDSIKIAVEKRKELLFLNKFEKKIIEQIKMKQKKQRRELSKLLERKVDRREIKDKLSLWKMESSQMFEVRRELDKFNKYRS